MKKLYLGSDKRLCGVCDGVARFINLDTTYALVGNEEVSQ